MLCCVVTRGIFSTRYSFCEKEKNHFAFLVKHYHLILMWECGFCCSFVVFSSGEQSEAINHRSEAINQQEPCWVMALGGFVKCPLRLPFA